MLNFIDQGHGLPVVLIHGLFGNLDNLATLGKNLLASGFRVVRIDVSNHGESPTETEMSYPRLAMSVFNLIQALKLPPCVLVGHSMGGKIAMTMALLKPEQIRGLVIADIAPCVYQAHHQQVFQGFDHLWSNPVERRQLADQALTHYVPELEIRQFLLKNLTWLDGKAHWRLRYPEIKANYPHLIGWPEFAEGAQYSGPTLFIKGEQSDYITETSRSAITHYFPNARAHIIPATGHWLHAQKPEAFNRIVNRFLSPLNCNTF